MGTNDDSHVRHAFSWELLNFELLEGIPLEFKVNNETGSRQLRSSSVVKKKYMSIVQRYT